MQIEPLSEKNVAQAAALGAAHMRGLREMLPTLPERYTRVETLLPPLRHAVEQKHGLVALQDGALVGYMTDLQFDFKQQQAAISPEWGHATIEQDARQINQALYAAMCRHWLSQRRGLHLMAWTANDLVGQETWFWQGFGLLAVDGLRDLSPLEGVSCGVTIRRATLDDAETLLAMETALNDHLATTPIYRWHEAPKLEPWLNTLRPEASSVIYLAEDGGTPLGYMGIGPASHDACSLIVDPATASINGAYLAPEARGQGVAPALLDTCLRWAREQGQYVRCAVDYESANLQGAAFWGRHFPSVAFGAMRYVDLRVRDMQVNWNK